MPDSLPHSDTEAAPRYAYGDLREWLVQAEKLGEVHHVVGATKEEDIGVAAEVVMREENANCVLFDEIPGHGKGYRVLVNFFGGQRKNMTLGFPVDLSKRELSEAYYAARLADFKLLPPVDVEDGPVLENVLMGNRVDLDIFPTPLWHEGDGGRYIGTGCYHVTADPDSRALNLGTYRVMVHDAQTVSSYISPGKHGRQHRDRYFERGEKMPVCVVLGGDPMTFLVACTEMPQNASEFDIVGGMRGQPIEVVRGKVTNLPFPADAEIVLEGFVDPTETRTEGPFAAWSGYYTSGGQPEPVMRVEAIYHRNDPIMLGCPPQRPPDEMCRYRAVTRSAMLRKNIQDAGVPGVTAAWAHEVGNSRMLLVVSIEQRYPGHSTQVGHIAAMCHVGAAAGKYVIVVDQDVDASDLDEVMWATVTRSDPATSIDIVKNAWSTPLDPSIPPPKRAAGDITNSRAIIDACRPYHWRDEFPPVNMLAPDKFAAAKKKWRHLLE
ncbi:MAG: UbiD family decarboxylase [Alphaproteobacteria bacterium]|nr:UbiD family decarboxylase [Alphaproteobacteria bacterium]